MPDRSRQCKPISGFTPAATGLGNRTLAAGRFGAKNLDLGEFAAIVTPEASLKVGRMIAMKTASTALAAAIALSTLLAAPAEAQSRPPDFGGWGGPSAFLPHSPPNGEVPLIGYLWSNPGFAPAPRIGCYFTRARMNNAWKRVEVCY